MPQIFSTLSLSLYLSTFAESFKHIESDPIEGSQNDTKILANNRNEKACIHFIGRVRSCESPAIKAAQRHSFNS